MRMARGFVLCFLLVGCAATPPKPAAPSAPSLSAHRLLVGSVPYLPASVVARELRGQEYWDAEAQIWSLAVGAHEVRASPQMPVVLVDGAVYPLTAPPVMAGGSLLLPERIWIGWLQRWRPWVAPPAQMDADRLRTIVIDAGHGGRDPGAIGRGGLREKEVTLDVARRLRDLLTQEGFRVVMTRYDDRFIPLYGRAAVANREGGHLFVSIHANASRQRAARGFEAYYLSEATDDHARALEAAENAALPEEVEAGISGKTHAIVWDLLYTEHRAESSELAAHICRGMSAAALSSKNRGVKTARFAVLKGARMPAVLVEIGFITHPGEEGRLRDPACRQRIAEGIRKGILGFRSEMERQVARAQ